MDAPSLAALLKDLIALPSINPSFGGAGEAAVADYVEDFLERCGADPERQAVFPGRDNILARIGPAGQPAVLLEAHMDTVAAEGWFSGNPFEPVEAEGRIYGRGACDTKSSLAVFLAVTRYFAEHPERLKQPILFAATIDEEEKQSGALRLMEAGHALSGAITGEPTLLDIIHAHKGVLRLLIRSEGVAAHSAFPERGENAILRMGRVLERLEAYQAELARHPGHPALGRPTVNVGTIRGGAAVNVVPDACVIDIDRRLLPQEEGGSVWERLRALVADLPKVAVEPPYLDRRGIDTPLEAPFARALGKAVEREKGSCLYSVAPYMTNATAYAAAGIPSLVFGPGDISQAHTKDEYVELAQLERGFRILVDFLGVE
jgi:acetylornithine deacetylase/succinyl-diaminopimelate desuccinylase family protein